MLKKSLLKACFSLPVHALLAGLYLGSITAAHAQSTTGKDHWQWLEAPHDPKALAWAKQQTQQTVTRLQALPVYPQAKVELDQVLKAGAVEPDITLLGHRAIRLLRNSEHPFGQLQVAERNTAGVPGTWRTVLDVASLRKKEGVPYELQAFSVAHDCLGPTYIRCLLHLSPGGGDESELREFDLDKGAFVKDGFRTPASRSMVEWLNQDEILIEHADANAPKLKTGWPAQVQLWHRGQPLAAATVVYQAKPSDAIVELNAAGTGAARYGVVIRAIDYSTFELLLVHQDGQVVPVPLPANALKPMGLMAANADAIIFQLARDSELEGRHYPAETLLAYAVEPSIPVGQRVSVVYTPPAGQFLGGDFGMGVVATRSHVAFIVNSRLVPSVMVASFSHGRWSARTLVTAQPGQSMSLLATAGDDDDLIIKTTGFTTPAQQYLYHVNESPRLLAQDPVLFDAANYTTEIGSATSRDGTTVDYFLLKPKQPSVKGPQPLLVTGYAAFGISLVPRYFGAEVGGQSLKLWLERGGSLVIPVARGGGERGDAWHRAAMREKRQNSYDDFIAVIEQLIHNGYTTPAHIGVFGESNGGLLAAVLGTERPDLFSAVVSDVPLTDLIRLKYMGMGAAWLDEYGDAADPAMAKVLNRYSPYQNVKAGVTYPPFMITTSTADNRVGPGHARKLAARLESVGSTVYFYEDTEGGHGVSDPLRNPQLMAMRMSLLISRLMGPAH